ncbi:hypothetical protein DPMN_123711 [Dreissena polymorpha]|uniref:Uncharacterized protein n=1 Tax=Dreissena polymorpha TaxID=45954 RepID=A0A9D4JVG1_DREPO|nr:hypothetical protein DPMN_123711 [Dreissena polymorpha]
MMYDDIVDLQPLLPDQPPPEEHPVPLQLRQLCYVTIATTGGGGRADIELSDEAGNVKNLRDPGHQQRYTSDFLEERKTLVLLTVDKSHSDPPLIMYKPLLQAGDGVLSEEFLARLALKGTEIQKKRVRSSERRDTSANVTEQKDVTARQVQGSSPTAYKGGASRALLGVFF